MQQHRIQRSLGLAAMSLAIFVTAALAASSTVLHRHIWGGTVTAIDGTTLTVTKVIGKTTWTYAVNTAPTTTIVGFFGEKEPFTALKVGDHVNAIGTIAAGQSTKDATITLPFTASYVRDFAIWKVRRTTNGTIASMTDDGFTMTVGKGDKAVTSAVHLRSTAKIYSRRGKIIAKTDLAVGHSVSVFGLWERSTNIITDASRVFDKTLPLPNQTNSNSNGNSNTNSSTPATTSLTGTVSLVSSTAPQLILRNDRYAELQITTTNPAVNMSIVEKNARAIALADIKVGDLVTVTGLLGNATSGSAVATMSSVSKIVDTSIPR